MSKAGLELTITSPRISHSLGWESQVPLNVEGLKAHFDMHNFEGWYPDIAEHSEESSEISRTQGNYELNK